MCHRQDGGAGNTRSGSDDHGDCAGELHAPTSGDPGQRHSAKITARRSATMRFHGGPAFRELYKPRYRDRGGAADLIIPTWALGSRLHDVIAWGDDVAMVACRCAGSFDGGRPHRGDPRTPEEDTRQSPPSHARCRRTIASTATTRPSRSICPGRGGAVRRAVQCLRQARRALSRCCIRLAPTRALCRSASFETAGCACLSAVQK